MKLLNSKKNPDKICELIYNGTPIGSCEDIIWNFLSNSEEKIELKKAKIDASIPDITAISFNVVVEINGNKLTFVDCLISSYIGVIIEKDYRTFESMDASYYCVDIEEKEV